MTVVDFTKDTQIFQALSYHIDVVREGGSSSYIVPPVTLGGCVVSFLLSFKVAFFHFWKFSQVAILNLEHLGFLRMEAYLYLYTSIIPCLFFQIRKFCASSVKCKTFLKIPKFWVFPKKLNKNMHPTKKIQWIKTFFSIWSSQW